MCEQDNCSIPYGFCHCGCGEKTRVATHNHAARRLVKGEPVRFVHGHSSRKARGPRYRVEACGLETPCWIWNGYVAANGYARVKVGDATVGAHRVYYERAKGPIPDGLHLDHLCRNRACVNPDHLEAVTPAENHSRGKRGYLTLAQAEEIRASSQSPKELARTFAVPDQVIARVLRGETYVKR